MINNFDVIKPLLDFQTEDDFYFLQIIRRKKENEDLGRNNEVVQSFYIHSIEQLEHLKPHIIHFCEYYNARAYINLNVRSFKKVTCQCVREFAQRVCDDNYNKPQAIFNTVCGQMGATRNKTWVIDIDDNQGYDKSAIKGIIDFINEECEPLDVEKFVAWIPTKNGQHIITAPFNLQRFKTLCPNIEVHKNNPTVLYAI